jgi:DNA-binding MarR family transcriptional regulator
VDESTLRFLPLYNQPGHIIRRAQQFAAANPEPGPTPLTPPQYSVLYAISLCEGLEQQEVAAAVFYDPVTTGAIVRKLLEMGAIRREPSGRSVRGRALFLAPYGVSLLAAIEEYVAANQVRLVAGVPEAARPTLIRLLSKVGGVHNSFNPQ